MLKLVFFWVILIQFVLSFLVTLLGVIDFFHVDDGILKALVGVLITEQAVCVFALFRSTDFFGDNKSINQNGLDLLATLWKYQQQLKDKSKAWSLTVTPRLTEFSDVFNGAANLHHLGYVQITENGTALHVGLTPKGIDYCQKNKEKLSKH